ncbi:hypothetical protein ES703_32262 [subsurface metagenome]
MKAIKNQLKKTIKMIRNEIEEREIFFDERTDKWQESEKAQIFQDLTDTLEDIICDLEVSIDTLSEN